MAIKLYTKEYARTLAKITENKSYFLRAFGGGLQVKDGVKNSSEFMCLKTSTTPVVIQPYDTGADVAFGEGTGNSNRFGPRQEIKSVDTTVPYEAPLAIHEGVDDFTVNDIPDQVVAERLEEQAIAWADYVDGMLGDALSAGASETFEISPADGDSGQLNVYEVSEMFAKAHKGFVDNKVSKTTPWVAYVNADVYNAVIDGNLATTAKGSGVNVDEQTIYKFKGFIIEELPISKFTDNEVAIFAADGVGIAGVGISVTRTIDSEAFDGVAIQGAGKYGKYIPEENKVAIFKGVTTSAAEGEPESAPTPRKTTKTAK